MIGQRKFNSRTWRNLDVQPEVKNIETICAHLEDTRNFDSHSSTNS